MNRQALVLAMVLPVTGLASTSLDPLPVEQRTDIKVVYQIKADDWKKGVTIVAGAYARIIDLQLRGYACIRF